MILNGNLKHTAAFSSFSTSSWHSMVLLCQEYKIAQIQASHMLCSECNISQSFVRHIQIAYSTRKALLCAETIACEMWLNTIMPYGIHYILLLSSPRNKENNFHHRCPCKSMCIMFIFSYSLLCPTEIFFRMRLYILNQYFFMSQGPCSAPLLSLYFMDINLPHAD